MGGATLTVETPMRSIAHTFMVLTLLAMPLVAAAQFPAGTATRLETTTTTEASPAAQQKTQPQQQQNTQAASSALENIPAFEAVKQRVEALEAQVEALSGLPARGEEGLDDSATTLSYFSLWLEDWWSWGLAWGFIWWIPWLVFSWQWWRRRFWVFVWPWPWWWWIPWLWFIPWLIWGWWWGVCWWFAWCWLWWWIPWIFWLPWWLIVLKHVVQWLRRQQPQIETK